LDVVEELLVVVTVEKRLTPFDLADHFIPVLTMKDAIFSATVMIDQRNRLVRTLIN
jgi:hypothetical protein